MDFLLQALKQALQWVVTFFEWIFAWLWAQLMGALITVLNAIPVPGWLTDAPSVVGAVPASVAFFLQSFELPQGLAIILGAYTIRFIIRRMPLIG